MRPVLPSLALVACVHQRVVVHPVEVAHASSELHARGEATIMMQREPIDPELRTLAMRDVVTAPVGGGEPVELTVGELLQDCPPGNFNLDDTTRAAYPRCKLAAVAPNKLVVADHLQPSGTAKTLAVLAVAGSFGVCAWKCPEPANYIAGGSLALAGTVVVIGVAALMYVALSVHD